jgi:hypothetical protein
MYIWHAGVTNIPGVDSQGYVADTVLCILVWLCSVISGVVDTMHTVVRPFERFQLCLC